MKTLHKNLQVSFSREHCRLCCKWFAVTCEVAAFHDILTLVCASRVQAQHVMYQHSHNRPMSVSAAAQLLSNTLYYKRFFPYYTFNLCAGLDEQGTEGMLCAGT